MTNPDIWFDSYIIWISYWFQPFCYSFFAAYPQKQLWLLQKGSTVSTRVCHIPISDMTLMALRPWGGNFSNPFQGLPGPCRSRREHEFLLWVTLQDFKKGVPRSEFVWVRRLAAVLRSDGRWTRVGTGDQSGGCYKNPDKRWWGLDQRGNSGHDLWIYLQGSINTTPW